MTIIETTTHRVDLPDGTIIRGDPEHGFWITFHGNSHSSYVGAAPASWDSSKAYPDPFEHTYTCERDPETYILNPDIA